MAKRRAQRGGGRAGAKGSGRPAGDAGQTVAGLAVLAAVLAGGTYLYRHTGASSAESVHSAPQSARPHQPALSPRVSAPLRPSPSSRSPEPPTTSPNHSLTVAGDPPVPPFGTSEEVFESGARVYAANCAGCHGRPGKNGKGPSAAQFWDRANAAGSHAIAQPAGALFQATAKGNLVAGMPSYGQRLTDTQIWDLALLLKSAHEDLPDPVLRLLRGGQ